MPLKNCWRDWLSLFAAIVFAALLSMQFSWVSSPSGLNRLLVCYFLRTSWKAAFWWSSLAISSAPLFFNYPLATTCPFAYKSTAKIINVRLITFKNYLNSGDNGYWNAGNYPKGWRKQIRRRKPLQQAAIAQQIPWVPQHSRGLHQIRPNQAQKVLIFPPR